MKLCRFDDNRLGLVEDETVADVSSALDILPIGDIFAKFSLNHSGFSFSTPCGAMQFTRMFVSANSLPSDLVKPMTPALAAL